MEKYKRADAVSLSTAHIAYKMHKMVECINICDPSIPTDYSAHMSSNLPLLEFRENKNLPNRLPSYFVGDTHQQNCITNLRFSTFRSIMCTERNGTISNIIIIICMMVTPIPSTYRGADCYGQYKLYLTVERGKPS